MSHFMRHPAYDCILINNFTPHDTFLSVCLGLSSHLWNLSNTSRDLEDGSMNECPKANWPYVRNTVRVIISKNTTSLWWCYSIKANLNTTNPYKLQSNFFCTIRKQSHLLFHFQSHLVAFQAGPAFQVNLGA